MFIKVVDILLQKAISMDLKPAVMDTLLCHFSPIYRIHREFSVWQILCKHSPRIIRPCMVTYGNGCRGSFMSPVLLPAVRISFALLC